MRVLLVMTMLCPLGAATWTSVPQPNAEPVWGLEENRGQAKAGVFFQTRRPTGSLAFDTKGIAYSPAGFRWDFLEGNPNPRPSLSDPLPGVVNAYSGGDETKWQRGIRRYAQATLAGVFPGVDVTYLARPDGSVRMRLECAARVDLGSVRFEIARAQRLGAGLDGSLTAVILDRRPPYVVSFPAPVGQQDGATLRAGFFTLSGGRFGVAVPNRDAGRPYSVEIELAPAASSEFAYRDRYVAGPGGDTFVLRQLPDAAGKDAPFPTLGWSGCSDAINSPAPCFDVSIARYSARGELIFVTYLEGETTEFSESLAIARDGQLLVTGTTDSARFPVSSNALQRTYSGPARQPVGVFYPETQGDYFLARLDARDGTLLRSTYWGGPQADRLGDTAIGTDGSIFVIPRALGRPSAGMPVSAGALQRTCDLDPCRSGYAVRFDANLERLIYATYLPGDGPSRARLGPDNSVYYTGSMGPGFPVTPGAYQSRAEGGADATIARLAPDGTRLLYGTYAGSADTDWILNMAVAPDGSVWVDVSSFLQCCVNIRYTLLHLDARLERVLARRELDVGDLHVDPQGRLHAITAPLRAVSAGALSAGGCGLGYTMLAADGQELFATNLPAGVGYQFAGFTEASRPLFRTNDGVFLLDSDQEGGVFVACVVDSASFSGQGVVPRGALLTIFGSKLGPDPGAPFRLTDNRLPTELGGTRVLVNGQAVPLLYAGNGQINLHLPYDVGTRPTLRVERAGQLSPPQMLIVDRAGLSFFRRDTSALPAAVALNEDGTVNSPAHPARRGSRVVLFATGGGDTIPPSVAGEVTPLELRPLAVTPVVRLNWPVTATVEYAGAAPGQIAGVIQLNIKLPDYIPENQNVPKGLVAVGVEQRLDSNYYSGSVTIAVEQ